MSDPNSRPLRKVGIADHLWQTYEDMARQMGADRDALINQALFTFARANGFIEVPARGAGAGAAPAPDLAGTPAPVRGPAVPARTAAAPARVPDETRSDVGARPAVPASGSAEKALDTAAQLDRLIKGKESVTDETFEDEESEPRPQPARASGRGAAPTAPPLAEDEAPALYVMFEDGDPEKVVGQTALIGRGRHCEFVIDSGKVSREHARIVREADGYFLEDLGSSNGTWFNKQRIKRRKIEDGDEFYICSEKVRFVLR